MVFEANIVQKMEQLIQLLNKLNYEYHVLNEPSLEDKVYDQIFKELKELETKYNFILPDSPTLKVGSIGKKEFFLVNNKTPMLSLDSTDDYEDLKAFDLRIKKKLKVDRIDYFCELKIDGLSASLIYQKGKLKRIATRGDGWKGEDVTFNQNMVKELPLEIKEIENCEIRGEIYMKKKEFLRLNEELKSKGLKNLANPRNAAAGTLRTLFPTQQRNLHFFAYQILGFEVKSQQKALKKIASLDFSLAPHHQLCQNIEEIKDYFQKIGKLREELEFDIDGIVIKVNDHDYYKELGETSRFPRWALAYKFPALITASEIKSIQVEITRNGRISYVACLEPVRLKGSLISKATLHNYGFIRQFNLNIGDKVILKKAGDIIPQIIQVIKLKKEDCWKPPSQCPFCCAKLEWNQERIYQFCSNENCSEKQLKSLIFFASKSRMDIKGTSEAIIRKLYQRGFVKNPVDFYNLESKKNELVKIEGMKWKSVNNLLNNVQISKKNLRSRLIVSLGIPLLGRVKSQKLIEVYPEILNFVKTIEKNDLKKAGGKLGIETQKEIEYFFQKPENLQILKDLYNISLLKE